jgi:DNA-binding SARP family transcriptional activator
MHIGLLGGFRLAYGDAPVTLRSSRLQSLLAYILLHRHAPLSRQHLSFLFWPDSSEPQARNNLRNLLYRLRRNLPQIDRFLQDDAQTIQ